jgi:Acetyl-CoA acetyltransferase
MNQAFICDAVRTPFGRFGGTLSSVRADDLGALPLKALLERNRGLDPARIDDVIYGCANQAGEDNRNVARMALLLAGYPETVPGSTSTVCVVQASTPLAWRRVLLKVVKRS